MEGTIATSTASGDDEETTTTTTIITTTITTVQPPGQLPAGWQIWKWGWGELWGP
jgi:hypothetical protein